MSETTITLPENFTIHHIEQHFGDLKTAFENSSETIIVDGSQVETIDTSGLQLMLALIKEAVTNNKTISWKNPTEVLSNGALKVGLNNKIQLS